MGSVLRQLTLVAAAATALAACNQGGKEPKDPNAAKLAEVAANPTFSVSKGAEAPILALQVRITTDAVAVEDARFIRAPLRKGDGQPDLMVIGMAGGRIVHKYPIPDPLNAQVEPNDKGLHGTMRLPQASVWIYMPATRLDVIEISPARDDGTLPRGGRIETAAVLGRLCPNARSIEDCALAAVSREDQGLPPAATDPGTTAPPTTAPPAPPEPPAPE